jgi:hypothetical protein
MGGIRLLGLGWAKLKKKKEKVGVVLKFLGGAQAPPKPSPMFSVFLIFF